MKNKTSKKAETANSVKPDVSSSHKEKDFVQWLTEDALPTIKDILAELKDIKQFEEKMKTK